MIFQFTWLLSCRWHANHHEDSYAWPDRIGVGDDGKHTTAKRAVYDEEAEG